MVGNVLRCDMTLRFMKARLSTTGAGGLPTRPGSRLSSQRNSPWMAAEDFLDVGCGPGSLTVRLAHLFEDAVGLDPDPAMIIEGRRAAQERDLATSPGSRAGPRTSRGGAPALPTGHVRPVVPLDQRGSGGRGGGRTWWSRAAP